eukprot:4206798-Amphidinium_carterae.1
MFVTKVHQSSLKGAVPLKSQNLLWVTQPKPGRCAFKGWGNAVAINKELFFEMHFASATGEVGVC